VNRLIQQLEIIPLPRNSDVLQCQLTDTSCSKKMYAQSTKYQQGKHFSKTKVQRLFLH